MSNRTSDRLLLRRIRRRLREVIRELARTSVAYDETDGLKMMNDALRSALRGK